MVWWRKSEGLKRQAWELRRHYKLKPSGNGHGRTEQPLIEKKRSRVVPLLAAALVILLLGARHCRPTGELTANQMNQARVDIYIGCFINDCTSEQLHSQLTQLETYYKVRKEQHEQADNQD